jgi:hypothetical protein
MPQGQLRHVTSIFGIEPDSSSILLRVRQHISPDFTGDRLIEIKDHESKPRVPPRPSSNATVFGKADQEVPCLAGGADSCGAVWKFAQIITPAKTANMDVTAIQTRMESTGMVISFALGENCPNQGSASLRRIKWQENFRYDATIGHALAA